MENTTQTQAALTLNDLATLRSIVEVAINRGAFKADEITEVGLAYDKLKSWLNSVAQPAAEQSTNSEPEETPSTNTSTATKQKGKK